MVIEAQIMQDFAGRNSESLNGFAEKIIDEIKKQMLDINFKKIDISKPKQDEKTKLFFVTVVLTVSAERISDIFKFYSFSLWGPMFIDVLSPIKYDLTLDEMQEVFNINSQIITQNTTHLLQQTQQSSILQTNNSNNNNNSNANTKTTTQTDNSYNNSNANTKTTTLTNETIIDAHTKKDKIPK